MPISMYENNLNLDVCDFLLSKFDGDVNSLIKFIKKNDLTKLDDQTKLKLKSKLCNCGELSPKEFYRDIFLMSNYWEVIKFLKGSLTVDYVCEKCGSVDNLNLHHKTYENRGSEYEHLDDLEVLCVDCHSKEHNIGNNSSELKKEIEELKNLLDGVSELFYAKIERIKELEKIIEFNCEYISELNSKIAFLEEENYRLEKYNKLY